MKEAISQNLEGFAQKFESEEANWLPSFLENLRELKSVEIENENYIGDSLDLA